jgi:acetylornithine deacetylase/succinyl-diaminopimelate desuccinylase-like protein
MIRLLLGAAVVALPVPVLSGPPPADELRDAVDANVGPAIELYREFLSLPNDAVYPDDIEQLLVWMEGAFGERNFATRRLATGGSAALYAERLTSQSDPTVLVYLQADGQPVDPSAWAQADPFVAVLKQKSPEGAWREIPWSLIEAGYDPDWRVFARSASDSKGPMTQFLMAIQLLDELGASPQYNLKVIIDTEEELGSPNLAVALAAHREILDADFLLIFDGPPHASNGPTVSFGARGIATVTLTTYGPRVAQHSGHYGNFVPNPAFDLARILASMKSGDGVVTIPGFYDGVELTDAVKDILAKVPDDEAAILRSMGVARPDAVAGSLQESIQFPSLNIRGMGAAWIGDEARTIIPPTATAELDIRLVKESNPRRLIGLIREHIESLGYVVLEREPADAERLELDRIVTMTHEISYAAFRSEFDSAAGKMARAGLIHVYGQEPILIRTMGGSIPISLIVDALGIPAAAVPTVNIDNNQHSPNENLRLGNFFEGIVMLMAVLGQSPDS